MNAMNFGAPSFQQISEQHQNRLIQQQPMNVFFPTSSQTQAHYIVTNRQQFEQQQKQFLQQQQVQLQPRFLSSHQGQWIDQSRSSNRGNFISQHYSSVVPSLNPGNNTFLNIPSEQQNRQMGTRKKHFGRHSDFHQEVANHYSEGPHNVQAARSNTNIFKSGRKRSLNNEDVSPTKKSRPSNRQQADAILSKISDLSSLPRPTQSDHSSSKIWKHFMRTQQTEEMFQNKMKLREALYGLVKGVFPYCGLYMVGSSMNGFGSTTSDLDMCLMVTHKRLNQKREATDVLFLLQKALRKCTFIREMQLIRAKVPILKFKDRIARVECDLNINNSVGIRNTYLMASYSRLDPRIRPLVMYTKTWARYHDINDARKMTLSSYSLTLMIIHYLQYSCKPAVLPCLHSVAPDQYSTSRDVRMMSLGDLLPDFDPRNTEPLSDLFLGFLEYYSTKFDFSTDVISVRLGKKVPKQVVIQSEYSQQWGFICIEEPFDLTNTARSVYDECSFMKICRVFQTSYRRLKNTKDLNVLFQQPF